MDNTSKMIYKILQVYSIRELFAKKLITNERREEASLATVTNTKKIRDWGGGEPERAWIVDILSWSHG